MIWPIAIAMIADPDHPLEDGFRLDPDGSTHDLGNLGGPDQSVALAINDSGQVIALSFSYAGCLGIDSFPAFRTRSDSAIDPATDNLGTLLTGALPFNPYRVSDCRSSIGTAMRAVPVYRTANP